LADLIGDIRKDYVLLSETLLEVHFYDRKGRFKRILSYDYEVPQDTIYALTPKSKEKSYLASFSRTEKQIFLLDASTNLMTDFPLAGNTAFEISDLFNDGKQILTVANDNLVYAYRLSHF
jgi:hypothetical protein